MARSLSYELLERIDSDAGETLNMKLAKTGQTATLCFALDHIGDGYSAAPEQHKHLWVAARDDGAYICYPQDRYLIHEASFTSHNGIPVVWRQRQVWSVEP